jgi:hypothetical protein
VFVIFAPEERLRVCTRTSRPSAPIIFADRRPRLPNLAVFLRKCLLNSSATAMARAESMLTDSAKNSPLSLDFHEIDNTPIDSLFLFSDFIRYVSRHLILQTVDRRSYFSGPFAQIYLVTSKSPTLHASALCTAQLTCTIALATHNANGTRTNPRNEASVELALILVSRRLNVRLAQLRPATGPFVSLCRSHL